MDHQNVTNNSILQNVGVGIFTTDCRYLHAITVPPSFKLYIPIYKFPDGVRYSLIVVNALFASIGILGNILTCHVFLKGKKTYTQQNLFLFNMAIGDLGILTISFPLWVLQSFIPTLSWPFGSKLCKILPAVSRAFNGVCLASMVAIVILRYRTVVSTLDGQITFLKTKLIMLFLWLLCVITLSLPILFTQQNVDNERITKRENGTLVAVTSCILCRLVWPNRLYEQLHKCYEVLVWYVGPLLMIYIIFSRTRKFINKQIHDDLLRSSTRSAKLYSDRLLRMKKSLRMLIVIFLLYTVLLLPWNLYQIAAIIIPMYDIHHHEIYLSASMTLIVLNSVLKPFVYYSIWWDFRSEFRKRYCGRKVQFENTDESAISVTKRNHSIQEGLVSNPQTPIVSVRRVDSLAWSDLKGNMYQLTMKRHAQIISSIDLENYDYGDILRALNENEMSETTL